jgi:hypothetical protein
MLRHDDVAINAEPVVPAHALQCGLEDAAARVRCKQATAMVAAECDEVTLASVLKAFESRGHGDNLVMPLRLVCDL